jgi:hypothetical protein
VSWAVAVFFASILMVAIVHELGHWYAGRRLGVRCRWVTARRGLVSVTFPATKSRDALVIAAAGPVSGVVMGLVAVGTLAILPPDWMILFGLDQLWLSMTLAAVVVTLMQVVSATPVTSDGRVIWQHLRHRRMAKDA